jgi:hypothetical protein
MLFKLDLAETDSADLDSFRMKPAVDCPDAIRQWHVVQIKQIAGRAEAPAIDVSERSLFLPMFPDPGCS